MYNVWTDADEDRAGEEIYAAADKIIDGLERQNEALQTRLTAAERLLIDLTPGGSEFHGSPERCAQWAQDRISFTGKLAAQRNRLRTAADALAVVAQRISDSAFSATGEAEFVIDPQDKAELDDALCEYREAK